MAGTWRSRALAGRHARGSWTVGALGAPDDRAGTSLRYDLGIRDGYLFDFVMDVEGAVLTESWYSTRETRWVDARLPASSAEAEETTRRLVALGATAGELRAALGPPPTIWGWWPIETWVYGELLSLELRLGVVEWPPPMG